MTQIQLEIGTEIFNHGDMANSAHFGTVVEVKVDCWGKLLKIQPQDAEINPYWVNDYTFSAEYRGHGATRLVTRAAYSAWVQQARASLTKIVTA